MHYLVEPKKKKKKRPSEDGVSVVEVQKKKKAKSLSITVMKDDYIAVLDGKKPVLCFAHNPQRNSAYVNSTLDSEEPKVIEYTEETLLCNFGQKPKFGKAYGIEIEPKLGEFESEIGHVNIYRVLTDEEKKAITSAIRVVHKRFTQKGLGHIFPIKTTNVRNSKGKWAGSYRVVFKDGEANDIIQLTPKFIDDPKTNLYIFAHEIGHAIWYRLLNDKYRALWLEEYNRSVQVDHAKKNVMADLFTSLLDSQLNIREFMKDIEADDLKLFKEALAYLKKYHKLTPEDTNLLLNSNSRLLGEIWPTHATTAEVASLVSDYARVSVHELFAEAVGFYFSGKELPKTVKSLMEKTIKFVAQ